MVRSRIYSIFPLFVCLLFADMCHLSAVDGATADELLRNAEARALEAPKLAIVVDGATLKFLLKPALNLSDRFYALLHHAAAVVCCRTNPRQKV